MTSMHLKAAHRGKLKQFMADEAMRIHAAGKAAVSKTTKGVQAEVRGRVRGGFGARGGQRLANTVRKRDYLQDEAGIIYSKFGSKDEMGNFVDYFVPFLTGATLRPKRSKFLYIPISGSRKTRRTKRVDVGDKKNLAFIPAKHGGRIYIVRKTKTRSTIIAILVPRVRMKQRLNMDNLVSLEKFPKLYIAELNARPEQIRGLP